MRLPTILKKDHIVKSRKKNLLFPTESEKEKIAWLLKNTQVSVHSYGHSIQILCWTAPTITLHVKTWLETFKIIEESVKKVKTKPCIKLLLNFAGWLEEKAAYYELTAESKFHTSLKASRSKVEETKKKKEQMRKEITVKVEARDGCKGCYNCGETDCRLEFDHIDPSSKNATVSSLLYKGKFDEAEKEALNLCRLLCIPCHRVKTKEENKNNGRPRNPQSILSEKALSYQRIYNKKCREYGTQRLLKAKLARGNCVNCGKICTAENAHSFDFDHRDANNKIHNMSDLKGWGDKKFYTELPKVDLSCAGTCHFNHTREQRASGLIANKMRMTRKRNRIETAKIE